MAVIIDQVVFLHVLKVPTDGCRREVRAVCDHLVGRGHTILIPVVLDKPRQYIKVLLVLVAHVILLSNCNNYYTFTDNNTPDKPGCQ